MSQMFSHHTTGLHTTQIVYAPCNFQIVAGSPPATSFLFNLLIKQHLPADPRETAGSVSDHRKEANIERKQVT